MGIGHCADANNDNNYDKDDEIGQGTNDNANGGQQKNVVSRRLLAHLECFACSKCKGR
jgi:hypothetical protein